MEALLSSCVPDLQCDLFLRDVDVTELEVHPVTAICSSQHTDATICTGMLDATHPAVASIDSENSSPEKTRISDVLPTPAHHAISCLDLGSHECITDASGRTAVA